MSADIPLIAIRALEPGEAAWRRSRMSAAPSGLLTTAQAAARLNCSVKTLNAHVAAGELRYVIIGKGTKRPRRYFTVADLDVFVAAQTREAPPCPPTAPPARRTTTSTFGGAVVAFTGLRKPGPGEKPKK